MSLTQSYKQTCISTTSVASQDSVQNSKSKKKVSNSDLPNKGSWSWLFRRSSQQENIKSKDDKEVVDILENKQKVKWYFEYLYVLNNL